MKWSALTKIKRSLRTPAMSYTYCTSLSADIFIRSEARKFSKWTSANRTNRGFWSFHTGVIKVWSSGMWHSSHRECSEPADQWCCDTSAKPRIIFHAPIFWHVTPCQLTYSYERIRGPSCLHLHVPSSPSYTLNRQAATPSEIQRQGQLRL